MILLLVIAGFIYWMVGPSGREKVKVALVVIVLLWLFAAGRIPKRQSGLEVGACAPGFDCSEPHANPLPPASAAMYDESGRPNSHGKVLVLPKVTSHHHPR